MAKKFDSDSAIRYAAVDNAGVGYCGRGTYNILTHMGLPATKANGCDWDETLPKDGWIKVSGLTPETAPPGAVLVYENDAAMGKANRGTGGGSYGHVEVVAEIGGVRRYVSDAARKNYGGTVADNFEGVYIHPSMMTAEQAQKYGLTASKSFNQNSKAGAVVASGANADAGATPAADNAAQFDGMNFSEMFKFISSILEVLFKGMSKDDAMKQWVSGADEVGQFKDDAPKAKADADADADDDYTLDDLGEDMQIDKPLVTMDNRAVLPQNKLDPAKPDVKTDVKADM